MSCIDAGSSNAGILFWQIRSTTKLELGLWAKWLEFIDLVNWALEHKRMVRAVLHGLGLKS